jgi:endonuclease/exonuclease/phosphatase family metal-dependent hydrolase
MQRLRVATLNIWHKSGPWSARLELIRRELQTLSPDLLGLQEVLRLVPDGGEPGPDTDQASEIAQGLGYDIAFGRASDYGGSLAFGNALLSRFPIIEQAVDPLPDLDSGESRSLLFARVDTPYGVLPVFVTHLNWKLHHGWVRLRQVRHIVERIFERAPVDERCLPPVLMGDFNAEPESDEIRYLHGFATVEGRSVFFADAWRYGGDGGPGYTFDRRNCFAAVSHEPPRRIDYIFVRGPDRKLRGEPLDTRICFAAPEAEAGREVWPSDHFGVVTELSVESRDRP